MKKYLFMAVAAIAAFSSCGSDTVVDGPDDSKGLVFTATMERNASRAILNNNTRAEWEEGDKIIINGKTFNAKAGGETTSFELAPDQATDMTAPYKAFFSCNYNGTTATLPAEITETWSEGKFNMPMYATSNTNKLTFKNLCGVLEVTVTNEDIDAVKSIRVSSENYAVSGEFSVEGGAESPYAKVKWIQNGSTITVNYTSVVAPTAEGVKFYVAVPPAKDHYNKLKIELSADGDSYTKSMTTTDGYHVVIERNKIYPIDFNHNGATSDAEPTESAGENKGWAKIGTGWVAVEYVQLWDGGPKWAKYNVGVTKEQVENETVTALGETYVGGLKNAASDIYWGQGVGGIVPSEYDPATDAWGSNWRMPTKEEFDGLIANCDVAKRGDGSGDREFTGKTAGYSDKSLYFRADYGANGTYWSATCKSGNNMNSYVLNWLTGADPTSTTVLGRTHLHPIRAVYVGE